eukprot:TRINITY_DN3966_c0_g4_i1.p1 TRINITY_DN3966_c0_g4~~TRINITY_DN3966_c0_g4_i1.p1  ORF type:complete len:840 (+),score=178.25 TRINITY_DN3966_c0_g4_i1:121-2520(+)
MANPLVQPVATQGGMAPQELQKMQMQQAQMMQMQMANMMMASMCTPMMYVPMSAVQGNIAQGSNVTPAIPAADSGAVPCATAAISPTPAGDASSSQASDKMQKYEKLVKRKQKDNANVVFVGGLRKTTEEDRVCAHFAKFGQVEHVDIKRLPDGTSRGFAFVKFMDTFAVDKVLEAHAKHMIDNKWVEVKRHDGMAACAGMTASLAKKSEEPAEEKEELQQNPEEYEEQWSSQYLQMAQNLGQQQQLQQQQQQFQESAMKQQMEVMKTSGMQQPTMQSGMQAGVGMNPMMMGMGMNPNMMMMGMQPCMGMNPMMMQVGLPQGGTDGAKRQAIGALPDKPKMSAEGCGDSDRSSSSSRSRSVSESSRSSCSKSRSRSSSVSKSCPRSRSPSYSKQPPGEPPPVPPPLPQLPHFVVESRAPEASSGDPSPPPEMRTLPSGATSDGSAFCGTLSSMLKAGGMGGDGSAEDGGSRAVAAAETEATRAAARAAAAMVAATANQFAVSSRDAAKQARKAAKEAEFTIPADMRSSVEVEDALRSRLWQPDPSNPQLKPPIKLWLPEPSSNDPAMITEPLLPHQRPHPPRPEPPPEARPRPQVQPASSPPRSRRKDKSGSRSRSRGKRKRSRSNAGGRRKSTSGWDRDQAPAQTTPSLAPPSRPALPPGVTQVVPGGAQQWVGHVQVNRFGIPEATREALASAVLRAQQVEAAGLQHIRETGVISRGPPDLPTACEVIEQKCVAYLIGKGGQALGAIGAAAGVSIHIDQSTKTFGWSMANIYGTEEGAVKAKMILRQKISEYRPLRA